MKQIRSISLTKTQKLQLLTDNCTYFNKGLLCSPLFGIGENITRVVLRNYRIKNKKDSGCAYEVGKMTNRHLVILFAAVCAVSAAAAAVTGAVRSGGTTAKIYVDGKLYKSIDLTGVRESYTVDIDSENGHNTILVEHGKISMQSADCPDKLCVKQGAIKDGKMPIVCLPHKISVSVEKNSDVDSVSR